MNTETAQKSINSHRDRILRTSVAGDTVESGRKTRKKKKRRRFSSTAKQTKCKS